MKPILLIGKRHEKGNESFSGGVIVLFEELIRNFDQAKIPYNLVDINYRNYHKKPFAAFFLILFALLRWVMKSKRVMLNGSNACLIYYAPILRIVTWLSGKPLYIRLFGGELGNYISTLDLLKKRIAIFSVKTASKIFYEPKHILNKFHKFNPHSFWFPNVRTKTSDKTGSTFDKRLVFLGHVKEDKGINYLLEAFVQLKEEGYTLHVYGPEIDYRCPEQYTCIYKSVYKGAVKSDEVSRILSSYDILVLPTFYKGEGYPGVIIEALNVGLPVVATSLDGIREMIDSTCGALIRPKSANEIIKGVKSIDESNYLGMSANAKKRFDLFDSEIVMERVIKAIII